jgi:hypothetical protein
LSSTREVTDVRLARITVVGVLAALALTSCSGDDSGGSAGRNQSSDDAVPPEVLAAEDDWPLPGRDYRNSRAVPESGITTATVDQLAEKWRAPLEAPGGINGWPAVSGDLLIWPVGLSDPAMLLALTPRR